MPIYALGDAVPDIHPQAYVHPDAVVIGAVVIGADSSVWPCAVLRGDGGRIVVGERTSIQDGTVVHTTSGLSPPSSVTTAWSATSPTSKVARSSRARTSARGRWCCTASSCAAGAVVAANSVLLDGTEVPSGALAVGAPAVIKAGRARPESIAHGRDVYVARARAYREELRRVG